ncbi:MAG: helix-turn-helix transcriptional regulator [Halobacteriota archaeon]
MVDSEPTNAISLLARREHILRAVGTEGLGKRELLTRLSVSRSTIDRGIRELELAGFVERVDEGYRRTLAGQLVLEVYEEFESRLEGILESGAALASLPPEADVDPTFLRGAEIFFADKHEPHHPIAKLCELSSNARWLHLVLPALFPQVMDALVRNVTERDLRMDIVVSEPVMRRLVSSHHEAVDVLTKSEYVTIRESDCGREHVPLIVETDDETIAGMLILDDSGARALLLNDDPRAVTWVSNRLKECQAVAERITAPTSEPDA